MKTLTVEEQADKHRQEDLQRLRDLRPIDDDFMRCMFKDNISLVEFVLRIIADKQDLIITNCETQKDMKRLAGARSICLDVYGIDSTGKRYDLEIQRQEKGADPHRARYHASVLDIENLHSGQEFKELPETYTIFITENDFYGEGKPFYPIERINMVTGKPFEDEEHILYVNGEYRGDSDIGRLMHDFNCTKADDMIFELIADRTRYLKENPKGVNDMCRIMEDMRNESLKEGIQEEKKMTVFRMLEAGKYLPEEIANISGLPLEEVKKLKAERAI